MYAIYENSYICIRKNTYCMPMYKQDLTEVEDERLFILVEQGNEQAFELVYEKYHRLLYVLAYRYLMDKDRAEDAVQEVFVKLWEYRERLNIGISLRNFLFTMVKNHVLNVIHNENSAIEKQYEIAQRTPEYEDDLVEKLEKREQMELFYEMVDKLPPQKKAICKLKVEEELSTKEIAERMHLSVNTIKTHYAEALKAIRRQLVKKLIIVVIIILFSC